MYAPECRTTTEADAGSPSPEVDFPEMVRWMDFLHYGGDYVGRIHVLLRQATKELGIQHLPAAVAHVDAQLNREDGKPGLIIRAVDECINCLRTWPGFQNGQAVGSTVHSMMPPMPL